MNTKQIDKNKKLKFKNINHEWFNKDTPNNHQINDLHYYRHNGIKYKVDGKNVVLDYSKKEWEIANWLVETFGGKIYMCPRINNPSGIKTPDYIYKGEKWDLKTIKSNSNQALYHSVYRKCNQSNNFIFDISASNLNIKKANEQVLQLFKREDTKFIKKIIIKKNKNYYVLKNECDRAGNSARPHSL